MNKREVVFFQNLSVFESYQNERENLGIQFRGFPAHSDKRLPPGWQEPYFLFMRNDQLDKLEFVSLTPNQRQTQHEC